jgi:pilus assembly protein CpaE
MERLLQKCSDRLNLLAAPATLERVYDFGVEAFDAIFDSLRLNTPCIVLDVPHQWTGWARRALINADDILVVAEPDLANLRNTRNLVTLLKEARPNDRPPLYCLNKIKMAKRPEIDARAFAKTLETKPVATIAFDSQLFGRAANNGHMIAEIAANHRTAKTFHQMAQLLTGHSEIKKPRRSLLTPILKHLRSKAG